MPKLTKNNLNLEKKITTDLDFLNSLISLYPNFSFKNGKKFKFRPRKTIYYIHPKNFETSLRENSLETFPLLLCHELAHAILGHFSYTTNLERVKIEVSAWEKTKELCKKFKIPFSHTLANSELDSYRIWLNQKSHCKNCGMTCFETENGNFLCPHCDLL